MENDNSLNLFGSSVSHNNLVEVIDWHIKRHPERNIVRFLADGEREAGSISYASLDKHAREIAACLQQSGFQGQRALLVFNNSLEFIYGFYGCLYAGVCAVPVYPPQNRDAYLQRLETIAADSEGVCLLGTSDYFAKVDSKLAGYPSLAAAEQLAVDQLPERVTGYQPMDIAADSLAFLQYTSGSTSDPKGVMVSHANLLHNIASMQHCFKHTQDDVVVSWLPMFHDMGLIGVVLQSICIGATCITMAPAAFLQRPMRWIEAISKYRGTTTFAPNFAYELCVLKAENYDLSDLDLSSWTMALNGAEPIKPDTLESFKKTFSKIGFTDNAIYPGYGLAEATLFVSGSARLSPVKYLDIDIDEYERSSVAVLADKQHSRNRKFVSSGMISPYNDVVIVDPDSRRLCADSESGEIWISGASVAQGYWRNPAATDEIFNARVNGDASNKPYLRTGDLGFIESDHLFIAGRIKEIIILRGANYHPQNLEEAIQSQIAGLKVSGGAAFTVSHDGQERLVMVQEVERTWMKKIDTDEVFVKARDIIASDFGLSLSAMVLIRPMSLPKTSSGKIQRIKAKNLYLDAALSEVAKFGLEDKTVLSQHALATNFENPATSTSKEVADLAAMVALLVAQKLSISIEQIDTSQSFYSLGLDSLVMAELLENIKLISGVNLELGDFLEVESIVAVAELIVAQRSRTEQGDASESEGISRESEKECEKPFPLSLNQLQMLLLHQQQPGGSAYNVPICLRGEFDVAKVNEVLARLLVIYPILSSKVSFDSDAQQWSQICNTGICPQVIVYDSEELSGDTLYQHVALATKTSFSIEQGENFRVELFRTEESDSWLLFNFHHVCIDFQSVQTFVSAFLNTYFDAELESASTLYEAKSYRQFVALQNEICNDAASKEYWQEKLACLPEALQWPDYASSTQPEAAHASIEFGLDSAQADDIADCAKRLGVTVNSLLLTVYQIFLSKLCGQNTFSIGVTNSGRPAKEYANTVGYFVQPAVFLSELGLYQKGSDLAAQTHRQMIDIMRHAAGSLNALLAGRSNHADSSPFQTLFTFYPYREGAISPFNSSMQEMCIDAHAGINLVPLPSPGAQQALSLLIAEDSSAYHFRFEYDASLFASDNVQAFSGYFIHLLETFVSIPESRTHELDLVPIARCEQRSLVLDKTAYDFGEPRVIHRMIESIASETPDEVAVRYEGQSFSYQQINSAANRLAQKILDKVEPRSAVGVYSERSVEMVISLVAVLKAGCAYVPIEPSLPQELCEYIINTADITCLLVEHKQDARSWPVEQKRLDGNNQPLTQIKVDIGELLGDQVQNVDNSTLLVEDNDAAYIIFTSGSTGKPKGVINTHGALRNRVLWMRDQYQVDTNCRILQKTPFTFDVSVWEFFLPLISGGTLVVARPDGHKDSEYLSEYIRREGITDLHFVPSMLDAFLASGETGLATVKQVYCSGEELSLSLQNRFFEAFPACKLDNLYGPTEAAIDVSYWPCQPAKSGRVPIGTAIANIELYILDQELNMVVPGTIGELYIAGEGLALGYVNQAALTAERFLPNPFARSAGERMYQTGDLARHNQDGTIFYLGRTDNQVKVRGFRIELGEIDACLTHIDTIKEAVTVVIDDEHGKRLASYVIQDDAEHKVDASAIKKELARLLPDYMVPDYVTQLESMPIAANGKLNRRALPAPKMPLEDVTFIALETENERKLAQQWAKVLGMDVQDISRNHNFFACGGHSLLAAKLSANCKHELALRLPVKTIFSYPVLQQQAEHFSAPSEDLVSPLSRVIRQAEGHPLSQQQERIWFLSEAQQQGPAYNIPLVLQISGSFDVEAFQTSINVLLESHEVLRTRYIDDDGQPRQIVDDQIRPILEQLDWGGLDAKRRDQERSAVMTAHAESSFDLSSEWPIRVTLIKEQPDLHSLLLCFHHIAADGHSISLLLEQLRENYARRCRKEDVLENSSVDYIDYVHWQIAKDDTPAMQNQLAYWQQQLTELPELLELPYDYPRPAKQTVRGSCLPIEIDSYTLTRLQAYAVQHDVSLYMLLLAAFKILLATYSGSKDIAVGTPVSGRETLQSLRKVFGFFANTLVLRNSVMPEQTLADFVQQVKHTTLDALEHQDLPLQRLAEQLEIERSASHSPLFQVMFSLEHEDKVEDLFNVEGIHPCQTQPVSRLHSIAKFDLSLMLKEGGEEVSGYFEFNRDLFDSATVEQMSRHLHNILHQFCQTGEWQSLTLQEINCLDLEDRRQMEALNNEARESVTDSVIERFKSVVDSYSDKVATQCNGEELTYKTLDTQSDGLAVAMRDLGVGAGSAVGLYLLPGTDAVVAMIATLKLGAHFIPFDTLRPEAISDMQLEGLSPQLILRHQGLEHASFEAHPVANIEDLTKRSDVNLDTATMAADDLAYIMYTSGSMGNPKGVQITHGSITRLVLNPNYVDLDASTVMLQAAPLAFDASTFEIWGALLNGGQLVICSEPLLSSNELASVCNEHGVNTAWLTASLFNQFVDESPICVAEINQLLVGGDVVSVEHVEKAYQACPNIQIINGYGPTETTTFAVSYRIPRDSVKGPRNTIPIGKAINGTDLHILDTNQRAVPCGVTGELYIGGAGLATGYLNQPELTDRRFVECQLTDNGSRRLYRTGDWVRRLRDGNIEFVGRVDNEVKLRGFRINLRDISAAILTRENVEKCVTIVVGDQQNKKLIAYVCGDNLDMSLIRRDLSALLPSYMVPAFILELAQMPLTRNGKLDHRALPDYRELVNIDETDNPKTSQEILLAEIWAGLLDISIEGIGRNSNFFELGGHSLLAARLVNECNARQANTISVKDVFNTPELSGMAAMMDNAGERINTVEQVSRQDAAQLSYAQSRIWFLSQLDNADAVYNVPLTLHLTERELAVDEDALLASVHDVIERHEVLRTRYAVTAGQPEQRIDEPLDYGQAPYSVSTLAKDQTPKTQAGLDQYIKEFHAQSFDLSREYPVRVGTVRSIQEGGIYLLLTVHHIATDGWSMEVLARDLAAFYHARVAAKKSKSLPKLDVQYLDFSAWQRDWLERGNKQKQATYWLNQLSGLPPLLDLPTDYPRPSNQRFNGRCLPVSIDAKLARKLEEVCIAEGCSLFMLLLACFKLVLSKYSGEQDIAVGSPVANRPLAELDSLIGFFANTLVLRTELSDDLSLRSLIAKVKQTSLDGFAHQDLPFEALVEMIQPERSLSYSPLFQVMFSLNHDDQVVPDFHGINACKADVGHETSKFDLSFMLSHEADAIGGYIEFSTDLYKASSIERMWQHYIFILQQVVTDLSVKVIDVRLESSESLQSLYLEAAQTGSSYQDLPIHRLFEQQVQQTPGAPALKCNDQVLSYQQLNERANQVARQLLAYSLEPSAACAVFLPRQSELLVTLLAILKAGAYYVPLDPNYPARRIKDIIDSAEPKVVITNSELGVDLPRSSDTQMLNIDVLLNAEQADNEIDELKVYDDSSQTAYAIYTSGTTGKPKGIGITHQNAAAMLSWAQSEYTPEQLSDVLAATSICFDLSIYELFLPLAGGGCVHLVNDVLSLLEPDYCAEISLINTVPSAMEPLIRLGRIPRSVTTINLAGEPLSRKLVDDLYQIDHIEKVYNLYGPSEDTTYSTYSLVAKNVVSKPSIGKPISNTSAYVLDAELNLLPVGVVGELYLAGAGVTQGYLGNTVQTANSYLPDPFEANGGRMYKTGDRVRLLPTGELDYLGRIDNQVKVRGFRIELDEVESVALQQEHLADAVAVVSKSGTAAASIVVYYTVAKMLDAESAALTTEQISQNMKKRLPDYMQPSHVELLAELPSLPNGKTDRKTLALRPIERVANGYGSTPLSSATEVALAEIWNDLLEVEQLGTESNFFNLGGHSLLATRLIGRIQERFFVTLSIKHVFENAQLGEQASLIDFLKNASEFSSNDLTSEKYSVEEGTI